MRFRLILPILGVIVPRLCFAAPTDEPGANWSSKCAVVFSDAFKYDTAALPQQAKDENLYKRVIVAVCWFKGQDRYAIRSGEHLFREYYDTKGKLVREGIGSWQFAPRLYLNKGAADDMDTFSGQVTIDATPFDDPYKED